MRGLRLVGAQLLLLLVSFLLAGLLVFVCGKDPLLAGRALVEGSLGSPRALLNVGAKATPLLLTGLAVLVAFRAGFWNLGAEGQFIVGATAAGALGTVAGIPSPIHFVLVFTVGFVAGGLWALLAAWFRLARGASEVISTLLLNFVAAGILAWLVHGWLMQSSGAQPIGDPVVSSLRLPRWGGQGSTLHAGLAIAMVAVLAGQWFFDRTTWGLQTRAVGANPNAAAWAGIAVDRRLVFAAALSGGIAGIAGVVELLGVLGRLFDEVSPGYGFTAIAVALLARLQPWALFPAALFFGILDAGASRLQQDAGISGVLVLLVQSVVILGSAASGALQSRSSTS